MTSDLPPRRDDSQIIPFSCYYIIFDIAPQHTAKAGCELVVKFYDQEGEFLLEKYTDRKALAAESPQKYKAFLDPDFSGKAHPKNAHVRWVSGRKYTVSFYDGNKNLLGKRAYQGPIPPTLETVVASVRKQPDTMPLDYDWILEKNIPLYADIESGCILT